jgi:hypothetical protein
VRSCHRPAALLAVGLLALAGCGPSGTARFVPNQTSAREALEAALNAWKGGQPVGRVEGHSPAIEVVDSRRQAGQKLSAFEITGEDTTPEGHRRFTVKLTLQQPAGTQEARYVVFGQDPLWVQREEDYQKLSGM